jgi:hypothetical protein
MKTALAQKWHLITNAWQIFVVIQKQSKYRFRRDYDLFIDRTDLYRVA